MTFCYEMRWAYSTNPEHHRANVKIDTITVCFKSNYYITTDTLQNHRKKHMTNILKLTQKCCTVHKLAW